MAFVRAKWQCLDTGCLFIGKVICYQVYYNYCTLTETAVYRRARCASTAFYTHIFFVVTVVLVTVWTCPVTRIQHLELVNGAPSGFQPCLCTWESSLFLCKQHHPWQFVQCLDQRTVGLAALLDHSLALCTQHLHLSLSTNHHRQFPTVLQQSDRKSLLACLPRKAAIQALP